MNKGERTFQPFFRIVVKGGMVVSVYSQEPQDIAEVIDLDNTPEREKELPEAGKPWEIYYPIQIV